MLVADNMMAKSVYGVTRFTIQDGYELSEIKEWPGEHQEYGVLITDTWLLMEDEWGQYAKDMLAHAYKESGIPVVLLAWPDAAVDQWIQVSEWISRKAEKEPRWLVWVLTGLLQPEVVDLRPTARTYASYDRTYTDWTVDHLSNLLESTKSVCPHQLLLYGGSARLWLYERGFDPAKSEWYTEMVRDIVDEVSRLTGVPCVSGDEQFEGIRMSYHMSWRPRVSLGSAQNLKELYAGIAAWAELTRQAKAGGGMPQGRFSRL